MANKTLCRHCFENGKGEQRAYCHERKAYDAQVAWNRKVRALLADPTPWYERPVPQAPDYSDHWGAGPIGAGSKSYNQTPGCTAWTRNVYALLASDGRAYRLLKAATARAEQTMLHLGVAA